MMNINSNNNRKTNNKYKINKNIILTNYKVNKRNKIISNNMNLL